MTGLPKLLVDAELGGSVIYEEYRGNLAVARAAAERSLASGTGPDSADAMLALAAVDLLQGAIRPARALLDRVEAAGPDPEMALRMVTYRSLAMDMAWRLFPDWTRAGDRGWQERYFAFFPEIKSLMDRRRDLTPSAGEAACLEAMVLVDLVGGSLFARYMVSELDDFQGARKEEARTLAFDVPLDFHTKATAIAAPPALLAHARRLAADLSHRLAENDNAAHYLQEALAFSHQAGDDAGVACSHMLYGDWLCTAASSPLVLDHYLREGAQSDALAWAKESVEFGLDARHAVTVAGLDTAAEAYDRAGDLFERARAPRGKAAVDLRRGFLAERRGDTERGLELAQFAAEEFDRAGDVLGSWVARAHAAVRRVGLGWLGEDRETAEELGAWGTGDGAFPYALGLGMLFARQGRKWLIRDGDYERSLACFRLAETTFRALNAQGNLANAVADQAETYTAVCEAAFALPAFDKAFTALTDLAAKTRGRTGVPRERAVQLEMSVYNLAVRVKDPDLMARTGDRLDRLLAGPAAAEPMMRHIAAEAQSLTEPSSVLIPLYRGQQARRVGRAAEAEVLFREALHNADLMGDASQREFNRAVVLGTWKKYSEATQAYQRYRTLRPAVRLGLMELLSGDEARVESERRLQQARVHEQDAAFFTTVRAYDEAEAEYNHIRELRGDRWWMSDSRPWESVAYLGEVAEGLGRTEAAVARYEEAISLLEARRGLLSRDELKVAISGGSAQFLYFHAARACLTLAIDAEEVGDAAGANTWAGRGFGYAERGKARALLDLMSSSALAAAAPVRPSSRPSDDEVTALAARWRSVSARLTTYLGLQGTLSRDADFAPRRAYLASQITSAEAELTDIEARLANLAPEFRATVNPQAEVIQAADVPALLAPGTVLLEYFFLEDSLLAWAFTSDNPARYTLATIDAVKLSQQILDLHKACQIGDPFDEAADDLAAAILKPFASLIDQARQVLVIPYGAAHVLPFAVLPWGGQPLIASRSISILPSASALRSLTARRARPPSITSVLAVGNPSNMSQRSPEGHVTPYPPLPGAAVEAAAVAGMFGAHGAALIGPAASKAAVQAEIAGQAIIHFATHGYLAEDAPLLSSILLADGQELTVYELLGLRIDAALVVLSACRTALGQTTAGDDVLGLSRGLLGAGAGAALVTLWPVGDISTCLLMQAFYKRLQSNEPPATALREAQNWLRALDAGQVQAALAALPATLAEPLAPPGATAGSARDMLDDDLQNEVSIQSTTRSRDYRHPRHWAPFVLVSPW